MKTITKNPEFQAAKEIAMSLSVNQMKKVVYNNKPTHFWGLNFQGKMYVIDDTNNDMEYVKMMLKLALTNSGSVPFAKNSVYSISYGN